MKTKLATFAGGCFWCMIQPFQKIPGVLKVIPGYTGGETKNPTYKQVSSGKTGHLESVQITYNPEKVKYEKLLDTFWHQINPEDEEGQFADRGVQYKTAIFYHGKEQKYKAEKSRLDLQKAGKFKNIVTKILKAKKFWPAEQYHWDYPEKHPLQYKMYKKFSGREDFIKNNWRKNE